MRIALGTLREPKIAGVRTAFARLASLPWPREEVELAPVDVGSGQPATPLSGEATREGARTRARAALAAVPGAALALGLEGGLEVLSRDPLQAVLRNWAVAWDGRREGVGSSAGVLLPESLARPVLDGEDLAEAIDRFAGERDVRSRQGAFGVLTRGVLTRADAYAQAVVTALAPWYKEPREG